MNVLKVTDPAFGRYGRVVENVDFTGLVEELKKTPDVRGMKFCIEDSCLYDGRALVVLKPELIY